MNPTSLLITDLAQTVPENQIVKSLSRCFLMTSIEYRCPYCNIVRNTNFVLSELLLWTKYLQYALQRMYELANDIDE